MSLSFQNLKKRVIEEFEVNYLKEKMAAYDGSVTAAAHDAQMDRANFHRLLRRYGLAPKSFRAEKNEEPVSQAT